MYCYPSNMEDPIVLESVRQIPIVAENTGFPFDDTDYEPAADRTRPFRSQLDDIAQRHPEFAEHLQGFPFRSNTWGRKRRGSGSTGEDDARSQASSSSNESDHLRQHRQPFGTRFDSFFTQPAFHTRFEEEEDPKFEFDAQKHPQAQQSPSQASQAQTPPVYPQQKPPRDDRYQGINRSRKQNPNVPQSNTVDLGQKAPPVDENRGQRSMSAPPDNRSNQRFVSSIHIPVNHPGQSDMGGTHSSKPAGTAHQFQQPRRPTEHVIPIHVEGRDEPVIPKNVNINHQEPPMMGAEPDGPEQPRMFGQEPTYFTQFLGGNRGQQPQHHTQQRQQQQQHPQQSDDSFRQQQQQYQNKQQQQFQQQQQQQQQPEAEVPPPQRPLPLGPIEQIKLIQTDVLELMTQVEQFKGTRADKSYIYLDEMLTRNLLKLDNIETEGKENIRSARKEAIKCIQSSINLLEAKANDNANRANRMEVEKSQEATAAGEPSQAPNSSCEVTTQMDAQAAPDSSEAPLSAEAASACPTVAAAVAASQEAVSSSSDVQAESSADCSVAVAAPSAEQKSESMEVVVSGGGGGGPTPAEPDSQTSANAESAATSTSQTAATTSSSQDAVVKK